MGKIHKFGLIGAGQIAYPSARSIADHPDAEVIAAQDLNPERLQKLCGEEEIPRSYETAAELFADKDVDAVYIAVPNAFHAPLAIDALKAGKHVILEKPFAMNAGEARRVIATAEEEKRVFTVGMNMRFREESQAVARMARDGLLGEIYHGKAYWLRRQGIPKLGTWFGKRELSGGGCLYDIGVHMLDLCLFTMDNFDAVSVSGVSYTKFGNRGLGEGNWGHSDREHDTFDVEDFSSALIRFANGATVALDVTWACHTDEANRNDVRLFGTDAGASCFPGQIFRSSTGNGEYEVLPAPESKPMFAPDRFHNLINHLKDEEPLCVSPGEALKVQEILDAIAESNRIGKDVTLRTKDEGRRTKD